MATTNQTLLRRANNVMDRLAISGNTYVTLNRVDVPKFSDIIRRQASNEGVRIMMKNLGNGKYRVLLRKNYWAN